MSNVGDALLYRAQLLCTTHIQQYTQTHSCTEDSSLTECVCVCACLPSLYGLYVALV